MEGGGTDMSKEATRGTGPPGGKLRQRFFPRAAGGKPGDGISGSKYPRGLKIRVCPVVKWLRRSQQNKGWKPAHWAGTRRPLVAWREQLRRAVGAEGGELETRNLDSPQDVWLWLKKREGGN